MAHLQPLIFEPVFQPRIWGGRRLATLFGKTLPPPDDAPIGESWEVVDLEACASTVSVGPARGRSLTELTREWGSDLLGRAPLFEGRFPLLIKFLDARKDLSVQVHPSPEVAERMGGATRVKHEAWYVLEADAGAIIYHDLIPGTSRALFRTAIDNGTVASCLRRIQPKPGQCFAIPSGTVHALGAGLVVAEIQTPSDTTFRVYDWDRPGPDGKPRELHIEPALESIRFGDPIEPRQQRSHVAGVFTTVTRLVDTEFFRIEKVQFSAGLDQEIPYAELVTWIILSGRGAVTYGPSGDAVAFKPGDTIVLPAALKNARIRTDDDCVWLEVTLPVPSDLAAFDRPDASALRSDAPSGSLPILPE